MGKWIAKIDNFIEKIIEKIPPHIRDIIRKASYALLAIVLLFAVTLGIRLGIKHAKPAGIQLAGSNRELLYLQELREENQKRLQLFEDVETDPMQFPSRQQGLPFAPLGRDTSDRLIGEREELLQNPDFLRPKEKGPLALEEEIFTPRLTPSDEREIKESEADSLLSPSSLPSKLPPTSPKPTVTLPRKTPLDFLE